MSSQNQPITKVYGDIGGNIKTFHALRSQMPEGTDLSLGDMVDRGPSSHEVLEWFRLNGKALLANHEHMMRDFLNSLKYGYQHQPMYRDGIWLGNGGDKTLKGYGIDSAEFYRPSTVFSKIPKEHIDYLDSLPLWHEEPGLIFTHAPIQGHKTLEQASKMTTPYELDASLLWNRNVPKKRNGVIQIYGHNSAKDVLIMCDLHPKGIYLPKFLEMYGSLSQNKASIFAMCLDTVNAGGKLSALYLPTFEIFQQEIID